MAWSGWDGGIGGVIIGAPAVTSYKKGQLDVFIRNTDNQIQHTWGNGNPGNWAAWDPSPGGLVVGTPAAFAVSGSNRIDLYVAGVGSAGTGFDYLISSFNHMHHKAWRVPEGWSGWEDSSNGIQIIGTPAVASMTSGRRDVFVRDTSNLMQHLSQTKHNNPVDFDWNIKSPDDWSAWDQRGSQIFSSPAAVSWGPNRIDCFAADVNNRLVHLTYDANNGGWEPDWHLPGDGEVNIIMGAPAVTSWKAGRLDVFFRGTDSRIHHKYYDNGWHKVAQEPGLQDGIFASDPCAIALGPDNIHCFAANGDNSVSHIAWSK